MKIRLIKNFTLDEFFDEIKILGIKFYFYFNLILFV